MDWEKIRKILEKSQKEKENKYNTSRKIVILSKKVILLVNNDSKKEEIEKIMKEMEELLKETDNDIALQEYIEARLYYKYVYENKLDEFEVNEENFVGYLKGLFDFVGELVRRAASSSIKGNYQETIKIYHFVNDLYDQLSLFDFRTSDLRKGYDSMRWNLRKLEDMAFSINAR